MSFSTCQILLLRSFSGPIVRAWPNILAIRDVRNPDLLFSDEFTDVLQMEAYDQ